MSYGSSSYANEMQKYALEQSRYLIAATVLYAIAFLGGLAVTALAFIKLRGAHLRHGVAAWLRVACIFFTLYCLLDTCSFAVFSPMVHQAGIGKQTYSSTRLETQLDAAQYMALIGAWFNYVTQGLLFVSIVVSLCAATTSTTSGSRGCLIVAYVLGTAMNGLAAAVFALSVKQYSDKEGTSVVALFELRDLIMAFDCVLTAAAVFAAGLALSRLSKRGDADGKPAKLAFVASLLLLLSALYQLAVTIDLTWVSQYRFGSPNYHFVLSAILGAWPLLGALALLVVAGKKWGGGGSTRQQKGSVA
ncbi:hypothetical protein A9K55_008708 [Cordyceps militaris]|uniref:Uncharacterized protein n=1 Tax=Cordyceps militaris TaxID=73501 RepID=A0A2H4SEF5_CORMI|nr:hypothetical protein A9K55_008708 [Cordyceps militaris]